MFIVRAARNLLPFDLQKGFTIIGHSLSSTFFPGRTRKSPELIFILILGYRGPRGLRLALMGSGGR